MGWFSRWRSSRQEPEPPPSPVVPPAEEPEDPSRCPKRWMGKRCVLGMGHAGICQWQ